MIESEDKEIPEAQSEDSSRKGKHSNAHDKRYRRLFSNPLIIEELMKYFVDVEFAGELDFSKMELQNTSFINEEHKRSEADMIWKINFKGNDVYIYLLIEFQSTVDRLMALRFGSYIFEFYKWLARQKRSEKLPAVFPILIYNGSKPWTAEDNIKDLIDNSIPAEYIPSFNYYKIIENELPKERLLKIHNALSLAFFVEAADLEEVKKAINEFYAMLSDEKPALVKEFTLWLNNLFITAGKKMDDLTEIIDSLDNIEEVKTMFIESVKEHEKIYMQRGRQQGLHEGMQKKAIDAALVMLANGAELGFIIDVTGLTAEEIEKLRQN